MSKTSRDEYRKKSAAWWREQLTDDQYRVLRQKGTEMPFSGTYTFSKDDGYYHCVACGNKLFTSDSKYESTIPTLAGWPSFAQAMDGAVEYHDDTSHGMQRTEVVCAQCGGHLGHVFDDESSPSGRHYCLNSVCLSFDPKKAKE